MPFMDNEAIEAAKSQPCSQCDATTGEECWVPGTRIPLMEVKGWPVHPRRCEI